LHWNVEHRRDDFGGERNKILKNKLLIAIGVGWLASCILFSGKVLSYAATVGEFNPVGAILLSVPAGILAVVVALVVKDKR
jgi:hypothetical protein